MAEAREDVEADGYASDPLRDDPRVSAFFGEALPRVRAFADLLADQGELRGLIGPRELPRLWERHILNSAAVAPFLPAGELVDVGSGAGLPGVVLAAMEPSREVTLIEPMERRTTWLTEAVEHSGIDNVRVWRGRAEEYAEGIAAKAVTARAVANVTKLVKWCAPLLADDGQMVFLKGRSAEQELDAAKYVLRKQGFAAEVMEAPTLEGLEPTRVVRLARP